jgi:hypothetical protein
MQVSRMMLPLLDSRISGLVASAVLIAIAAVLISPAVPSAPTLLPASVLLLGVAVIAFYPAVRRNHPVIAVLSHAQPISPIAGLEFVTAGLPLRR